MIRLSVSSVQCTLYLVLSTHCLVSTSTVNFKTLEFQERLLDCYVCFRIPVFQSEHVSNGFHVRVGDSLSDMSPGVLDAALWERW